MRRVASAAALLYLATLLAAPLIDRARDVLRAYPEDYSPGTADAIVRLGYVAATAMALAIAATVARGGWARRAGAVMLVAAGAASLTLAVVPQQVTGGPILVGVLGFVLAPLVLSLSGRRELPRWCVALGVAVSLGFLSLAMAPRDVAGITNRVWDVLLALWAVTYPLAHGVARDAQLGVRPPGG